MKYSIKESIRVFVGKEFDWCRRIENTQQNSDLPGTRSLSPHLISSFSRFRTFLFLYISLRFKEFRKNTEFFRMNLQLSTVDKIFFDKLSQPCDSIFEEMRISYVLKLCLSIW